VLNTRWFLNQIKNFQPPAPATVVVPPPLLQ